MNKEELMKSLQEAEQWFKNNEVSNEPLKFYWTENASQEFKDFLIEFWRKRGVEVVFTPRIDIKKLRRIMNVKD